MKIGILQSDDLRDNLKRLFPAYSSYATMFEQMFASHHFSFTTYDVRDGIYPHTVTDEDAYLITGSRHGVYDPLFWLSPLFETIRNIYTHRIPLLGICFGHQAIAHALGGQVQKSEKGWGLGLQSWPLFRPLPAWMQSPQASNVLRLLSIHQDQVIKLPKKAKLLAGNDFCPNASFFINDYVFCVQGHPEFTPDFMRALLNHQKETIGPKNVKKALLLIDQQNDHHHFARWVGQFFNRSYH